VGAILAFGAVAVSVVLFSSCLKSTIFLSRWELGMDYAKHVTPSEFVELGIQHGAYVGKYRVNFEDGSGYWRTREFGDSEIDDTQKMKVDRKFNVVYIEWDRAANRPDFVEAFHAPRRKLWLLLDVISTLEAAGILLLASKWLRGRRESPPRAFDKNGFQAPPAPYARSSSAR